MPWTNAPHAGPRDPALEPALRARANEVVYQSTSRGVVASLGVAAVMLVGSEAGRNSGWGWTWLGALAVVYAVRIASSRGFHRASSEVRAADSKAWRRRLIIGVTVTGVVWAMGLFPLWVHSTWHDRVIFVMAISGLLPGVTTSMAAIPPAFMGFIIPVCLSVAVGLFTGAETPIDVFAAIGSTALLPMLLRSGRTLHDEFDRTTRLRLAQDQLLIQLERARDAALASAGARSEFLAVMSHELRTPLNGVIGTTSLLLDAVDPAHRDLAQAARDSAQILLELIDGVLDLSKIDAGHLELESVDFELHGELTRLRSLFELRAREKGLILALEVDPAVPQRVRGDWFRLRQVLVNLLGNAFKFTSRGSVTCTVRPGAGPDRVSFAIRDTGIGLTAEQRGRIFEPFVQASATTSRRYGGTGLGLTICKRLVTLMGGELGVDSVELEGSTFHFEVLLPAAAAESPRERPALPVVGGEGRRVLVCDDNEINLTVATRLLQRAGYTVEGCRNGAEAITAQEASAFDAVLMDLQMPVMDGFEALRRARAPSTKVQVPRVPCIALTASASVDEREACLKAGFEAFLTKPIDPAALMRTLAEVIRASGSGEATGKPASTGT